MFNALYHDGTEEEVEVYTPLHAVVVDHDRMLLRGTKRAATQLLAGYPSSGDAVCMAGFAPGSATACFSKGRIGSISLTAMNINADEGRIGGPVCKSQCCRLVGIISKGADAHIKQPYHTIPYHRRSCTYFFSNPVLQGSLCELAWPYCHPGQWHGSPMPLAMMGVQGLN